MEPVKKPTVQELEAIRKLLLATIAEAERIFDTEHKAHELLTSKAALAEITELLEETRDAKRLSDVSPNEIADN